ncbi:Pol polyprotein [Elysia marginata]|uniref:Pol polyprotein n=1 Tax=Elysia marginata TaxID=1093978 RepID=A0AAV4GTL2_9GAST|nr:Pol polyprotein [Elysia marginata]
MSGKLPPPERFDFSRPAGWPEWKRWFLRYRAAIKLDRENADVQISTLIYSMGKEADNIFTQFPDVGDGVTTAMGKTYLQTTRINLNSPGGPIKCLGKFQAHIQSDKNVETNQTVHAIETRSENLLGRRATQALSLVSVIDERGTFEEIKCSPIKIILQPEAVLTTSQA